MTTKKQKNSNSKKKNCEIPRKKTTTQTSIPAADLAC